MCGRFSLTVDPAELQDAFRDYTFPEKFAPRFNIAPTQPVLAIPNDGRSRADFFVWGLIPSWSKAASIANRLINARVETLGEKPYFAGIWDEWHSPDCSEMRSCTIITTEPNELMAPIHDRMPVILEPGDYPEWLDTTAREPASLNHLLKGFPAALMEAYPVSTLVNSPANDSAECILPA